MPTTPRGLVYPGSTEHTRLWEHLQNLAVSVDDELDEVLALLPVRMSVRSVVVEVVSEAFESAPVVWPVGRFTVAPAVFVSSNVSTWFASRASVTADGCNVTVRHLEGTAATVDVTVQVLAVQFGSASAIG